MSSRIVAYEPAHVPAVQRFNAKLKAGGCAYTFPESPIPAWLPRTEGQSLYQEHFLVFDGSEVHGGYILKHQDFVVGGRAMSIGNFQLPLSEGVVDGRFAAVAIQLLRDALRRQPLLYSLGLGSLSEPVTRMLAAMHWTVRPVPFFFYVCNASRFLRGLSFVRKTALRRLALDAIAATGLGTLGVRLLQNPRKIRRAMQRPVVSARVDRFGPDADALWEGVRSEFSLSAIRNCEVLARLYDRPGGRDFIKIRVDENGALRGWAVLLATPMVNHKYFGNLRLGTIVDALCTSHYEAALVSAAVETLQQDQVDLIISNQSYAPLGQALTELGFRSGPSNFFFAASPQLAALLNPTEQSLPRAHLTRGDGDGPIHL